MTFSPKWCAKGVGAKLHGGCLRFALQGSLRCQDFLGDMSGTTNYHFTWLVRRPRRASLPVRSARVFGVGKTRRQDLSRTHSPRVRASLSGLLATYLSPADAVGSSAGFT
jgi:hypothetical protein